VILLGRTFTYDATGPVGLLRGKRAAVLRASGTRPDLLAGAGWDFHEGWTRTALGSMGITDVELVLSHGLMDLDEVARTRDEAVAGLGAVAARLLAPRVVDLDVPAQASTPPVAAG
jgi:FMN-dependent NADH-azoreductase